MIFQLLKYIVLLLKLIGVLFYFQEYKCENPFNTDVDFELLPLRQKVEILRALCDFRLDAEDVVCVLMKDLNVYLNYHAINNGSIVFNVC